MTELNWIDSTLKEQQLLALNKVDLTPLSFTIFPVCVGVCVGVGVGARSEEHTSELQSR